MTIGKIIQKRAKIQKKTTTSILVVFLSASDPLPSKTSNGKLRSR